MRFLRRPGSVALVAGIVLFLAAGWFFTWTWSAAMMRCVPCDCRYDFDAADAYCRLPAFLLPLSQATLAGSVVSFVVAWVRRRRARRLGLR